MLSVFSNQDLSDIYRQPWFETLRLREVVASLVCQKSQGFRVFLSINQEIAIVVRVTKSPKFHLGALEAQLLGQVCGECASNGARFVSRIL